MKNKINIIPELTFLFLFLFSLILLHLIIKHFKIDSPECFSDSCKTCSGSGDLSIKKSEWMKITREFIFLRDHKVSCKECDGKNICIEAKNMLDYIRHEINDNKEEIIISCPDCGGLN